MAETQNAVAAYLLGIAERIGGCYLMEWQSGVVARRKVTDVAEEGQVF